MRRYYPGITIFKLGGSLLVLLSHGLIGYEIVAMPNQQLRSVINILNIIVPCFYIIAGFLAYKGWTNAKNSRLYIQKYLTWIILVYGFFCLIFIWNEVLPEVVEKGLSISNLVLQANISLRMIVLDGPFVQFWFIPPLVFGIIASYWFYRKGNFRLGVILVLLGFLLSQLISGTLRGVFDSITNDFTFLPIRYLDYLRLFMTRYFGYGLTFVFAGVMLARYEDKFLELKVWRILLPAVLVSLFESSFLLVFLKWRLGYSLTFSVLLNTILLFYGVLHIKNKAVRTYHKVINLFSMVTFFGHSLFFKINIFLLQWNPLKINNTYNLVNLFITLVECVAVTFIFVAIRDVSASKKKERDLAS
jgi:hypothetical protein